MRTIISYSPSEDVKPFIKGLSNKNRAINYLIRKAMNSPQIQEELRAIGVSCGASIKRVVIHQEEPLIAKFNKDNWEFEV